MTATDIPDLADVLAARARIAPYLRPTPLYRYPVLDTLTGARLRVKHENHQPVGAFKVRGGVNLISQLSPAERDRGVASASTGNHGQSIAYAADLFGVRATIFVPEQANPVKVESMRALGAQIVFYGKDFDEAREQCEKVSAEQGYRYIHSGNEPALIAGVGTYTLEILAERPDTEVIVVPVGGGSGAAGACLVANAVRPSIEVIGVQSAAAPHFNAAAIRVFSVPPTSKLSQYRTISSGVSAVPSTSALASTLTRSSSGRVVRLSISS